MKQDGWQERHDTSLPIVGGATYDPRDQWPRPDAAATSQWVAKMLRAGGVVHDSEFDALFPEDLQVVSARFWTPVGIAERAVELLTEDGASRILDVGAGPGKVCLVGALTSGAHFTGLEQRRHLVEVGQSVASSLGVGDRATFIHGRLQDVDFNAFDAFYFFNPFAENLFTRLEWLDASVEVGERRILEDVRTVEWVLTQLRVGTRVVTYHGLGWRIPNCFELRTTEPAGSSRLRSWVKTRMAIDGYHLDFSDETARWAARVLRLPRIRAAR
jgi:hypothetical protein